MRSTRRADQSVGLAALFLLALGAVGLTTLLPPAPDHPLYLGAGNETPVRGGTFVFHHESDLRGLDPQVSYDEISAMAMKLLFEGLIDYDADLGLVPRIAESLPEVSDDALLYTFRLRGDVRFSNGRTVVADDVRWSMEHMLDPDTGSPGALFYRPIDGYDDYTQGRAEHLRGIEVVDERTVRFRLSRPDHTFLNAMAMLFAYPVARENYEAHPDDVSRHPLGTGAYLLEEWEPGVRLTFVRNPDHFLGGGYPDRMVYELNLERAPAFLRFQNADLDHLHRLPITDYLWMRRAPAWAPYRDEHPLLDAWGLIMNCELPPFDDVHVRRAVAFAVDRERWARARANRIVPNGQPLPAALDGYDPELPGLHRLDVARAREEMAAAGHPVREVDGEWVADGLGEVELWVGEGSAGRAYGELAQQDLAQIGIRIRLRQVAFPIWLAETGTRGRVQMTMGGWSADFPDASNFLDTLYHSRSIHDTGSENRAFYHSDALDALLDEAHLERDPLARAAMYRDASRLLVEDAPWAFVFSQTTFEAWQPYVRGYEPNAVWNQLYRDLWLDLPRRRFAALLFGDDATGIATLLSSWGEP
jgi:ABC-type transport system substrate-binding protein